MKIMTPDQRARYLAAKARYRATHKAEIKAATKKYISENKDIIRTKKRAAYAANPAPAKARARKREALLKEIRALAPKTNLRDRQAKPIVIQDPAILTQRLRARKNAYNRAHPEQARARQRRLWKERPEVIRERLHRQRARKRNATIGNPKAIQNWERRWKSLTRVRCYWCAGNYPPKECQTDHITALSIGGAHSIENLCIACARCNQTKSAMSLAAWNARLLQPALL